MNIAVMPPKERNTNLSRCTANAKRKNKNIEEETDQEREER